MIPAKTATGGVKRPRPKPDSSLYRPGPGPVCDLAATPKPIAIADQPSLDKGESKDDPLRKRFTEWFEKSDISHESRGYVWKLFVHIQNQNKQLKHFHSELQKIKTERVTVRKEAQQSKIQLEQRKKEAEELALRCKQFAETRSSDLEKLKKHMIALSRKLEIERVTSRNLRAELKECKRARSGDVKDVTMQRNWQQCKREQLLEQQVNQMRDLLAHRNQERVLRSSQILNEYNKIKRNYDQALKMIHQLRTSLAQATVVSSQVTPS